MFCATTPRMRLSLWLSTCSTPLTQNVPLPGPTTLPRCSNRKHDDCCRGLKRGRTITKCVRGTTLLSGVTYDIFFRFVSQYVLGLLRDHANLPDSACAEVR